MIYADSKELYSDFLLSDFWIQISRTKRKQVGKCEQCGSTNRLQAHHKRYTDNLFDVSLGDLVVLCRECHSKQHGIVEPEFMENGLDDTKIPEHAFVKPQEFTSFRQVLDARNNGEITRFEFVQWKRQFRPNQSRRLKRKQRHKPKRLDYPTAGLIVINHYYGNHRPYRPKWINRGTSSN